MTGLEGFSFFPGAYWAGNPSMTRFWAHQFFQNVSCAGESGDPGFGVLAMVQL
jgi:hypothetical protein